MQNFKIVTDCRRIGTNFIFQGFRYERCKILLHLIHFNEVKPTQKLCLNHVFNNLGKTFVCISFKESSVFLTHPRVVLNPPKY